VLPGVCRSGLRHVLARVLVHVASG
jgi:hypothetical protein